MEDCTHHYKIDDDLLGICSKCGNQKQFDFELTLPKKKRRYWEISYELLRDKAFDKENEEEEYD